MNPLAYFFLPCSFLSKTRRLRSLEVGFNLLKAFLFLAFLEIKKARKKRGEDELVCGATIRK